MEGEVTIEQFAGCCSIGTRAAGEAVASDAVQSAVRANMAY